MRILLVNDYLDEIGGAEIYVLALRDELMNNGHEVHLFTSDGNEESFRKNQSHKTALKLLDLIFSFYYYKKFKKVVKKFKPDVIHIHGIFNELSPSIILAAGNIPVVMTVHDFMIVSATSVQTIRSGKSCKRGYCQGCLNCVGLMGTLYQKIKLPIHRILLGKVKEFIAPSEYLKNVLQQYTTYEPIIHIKYGFRLLEYSRLPLNNSILFAGRITVEKGLAQLIRSFNLVLKKHEGATLYILGDGPELANIVKLSSELNISQHIKLIGKVSHKRALHYYNLVDMVVVPSICNDNLPLVALEAINAGRPLIVSNSGGLPELVRDGENGYVIDPNNYELVSKKIGNLFSHENILVDMHNKMLSMALKYNYKNHIENILKIYTK